MAQVVIVSKQELDCNLTISVNMIRNSIKCIKKETIGVFSKAVRLHKNVNIADKLNELIIIIVNHKSIVSSPVTNVRL